MGRVALKPRPRGWSIGAFMALILAVALMFWSVKVDPSRAPWERGVLLFLLAGLVAQRVAVFRNILSCPACAGDAPGRVYARPFGLHYFRCVACGQRMKQSPWLGRVWDASGPEDDRFFEPRTRPVATWGDGPILPVVTGPETRTVAGLLRGKLDREAAAPPSVEIAPGEAGWVTPGPGQAPPPIRRPVRGVKSAVIQAILRTWDAIRWAKAERSQR